MKVLLVVPDLFRNSGGIARYCRLLCKALSESPQVTVLDVIALHDSEEMMVDPDYYDKAKGTYLVASGNLKTFMWQIFRSMTTKKYDFHIICHVNFATFVWLCSLLARKTALVLFAYGIEVWERRSYLRRIGMLKADSIFAISDYTRQNMSKENDIPLEKIPLLYNCLDPLFLQSTKSNGGGNEASVPIKLKHPNMVTVARLSYDDRYKGHANVIKALSSVSREIADINYYVVGRGDLMGELKALASELEVSSHVHFLGFVSEEELISIYKQCDSFVMPSKKEGFGFVFAEAMAYGIPVIAGNQDASVEVVRDQETGVLVDPDNVEELTAAMLRLLSDAELRDRMGKAGRVVVEDEFSFKKFQGVLVNHLQAHLIQHK